LTTVRQPIRELGEAGANFLFRLIEGEMVELPVLRLPVELMHRDSVRAVPSPFYHRRKVLGK